jgi:type I restriction enzyme S subunit
LRITDIDLSSGKVNWLNVPYCKINDKNLEKYKLKKGDIVFARIGATTGKTSLIKNPPDSVFASYLIRYVCNHDLICPDYLFYFTQTNRYWMQVQKGKEGKLKKGVNSNQLKKFIINLPKLETQKQIAAILSEVDDKIEKLENKRNALDELFKSMLHDLMTANVRVNHLEVENG